MRIRVTMPNGNEKDHRIRSWRDFRRFVNAHHKYADNIYVDADDDCLRVRVGK